MQTIVLQKIRNHSSFSHLYTSLYANNLYYKFRDRAKKLRNNESIMKEIEMVRLR